MRRALIALMIAGCGYAQSVVDPAHVATALSDFGGHPTDVPLRCDLVPVAPAVDFAFRFQAGFTFRIPVTQYQTAAHAWFVLIKITPQEEGRKPVYLFARTSAAEVVKTDLNFEVSGGYVLGEGQYAAEATLYDDSSRTCKREWPINAELTRPQLGMRLSVPPFTVRDLPGIQATDWERTEPPGSHAKPLTILLNAAPLSPRRTRMHPTDRNLLLSAVAAIMGRVPATSVRLVVFSLEAQKELFRSDNFSIDGLAQAAGAIDSLELSTVDVRVLQNPTGGVDLLTRLINQELRAEPAGEVVLLGPLSKVDDRIPDGLLERRSSGSRIFYVQYRPVPRRIMPPTDSGANDAPVIHSRPTMAAGGNSSSGANGASSSNASTAQSPPPPAHTSDSTDASTASTNAGRGGRAGRGPPIEIAPPSGLHETDVINAAVARLKGRTMVVHTPVELAKAILVLERGR